MIGGRGISEMRKEENSSSSRCWVEGPGGRPQSDHEYFERLTRVVFQAGMNWRTIDSKWPGFREAFANFSIKKVAAFDEEDIQQQLGLAGRVGDLPQEASQNSLCSESS